MSPRGIHLFLGPDRAGKLQRIQALERSLTVQPLDRHHLDGAQVRGAELIALCRQQPALSSLRLVVVDQAHRLDQACVAALLQHAGVIAKSACLVLLVETELSVRHALSHAAASVATERFVGRNTIAAKPFALTDALGTRDAGGALASLHDQLLAGKEPLELLGLVAWQLQRWVSVKRLSGAGWGTERIAQVTGLKPWQVERVQGEVARRPLESLQQLLERCWQLDVDAKSGRTIAELAIEELVIEICRNGEPTVV
ncbi:MAG: hypothetical protein HY599_06905 [Candidatus Omnitrophica bacterium]|nr:hypothetical protein [Candidatus Omnitrophota bacterium]